MDLEELKKEYATQDNRFTAYPTYVTVQELVYIGVMADGYSANCPYDDGITKIEYFTESNGSFNSYEEAVEIVKQGFDVDEAEDLKEAIDGIREINVGYIWHPVEFFLTIKGAKEYMKANAHNHGKLRTYVHHFERRNFEMRGLLGELKFKVKD